jgi:ParB family chromosome partitioning protein
MDTVKSSGIPSSMEQEMDGDDVVVTLRIKNVKKRKDPNVIKLF